MSEDKPNNQIKDPVAALVDSTKPNGKKTAGPIGKTLSPDIGKATQVKKGQRLPGAGRKPKGMMTAALQKMGAARVPKSYISGLNAKGAGLRYGITWSELAALGMIRKVAEGVVENFDAVANRTDGPVPQEISGPKGGPIAYRDDTDVNARDKLLALSNRVRDRISKSNDQAS